MSRSYLWEPAPAPPVEGGSVGLWLWSILCERYDLGDDRNALVGYTLDHDDITFLTGVALAASADNREDVDDVIAAIRKHGTVVLKVEY